MWNGVNRITITFGDTKLHEILKIEDDQNKDNLVYRNLY